MPQPYPGQQWKHGWIPLTSTAARQKNHGRPVSAGSSVAQLMDGAIRQAANRRRGMGVRSGDGSRSTHRIATASTPPEVSGVRRAAEERERRNPYGSNTIARNPNNLGAPQSVYTGSGWMQITSSKRRYGQDGVNMAEPGKLPRWYPLDQVQGYVRRHNEDLRM